MTTTSIKFIYFDVGMIMDTYPTLEEEKKNNLEEWELGFVNTLGPNDRDLCLGTMSLTELWNGYCKQHSYSPQLLIDPLNYLCSRHKPRKEMHYLADQLRSQYQVGLLTNMYSGLLDRLIDAGHVPPRDWFSAVVDSSLIHIIKPDKKIYEFATKQACVKPEEIAFVDDRLTNVEAARRYGWTGWYFDLDHPEITIRTIAELLL